MYTNHWWSWQQASSWRHWTGCCTQQLKTELKWAATPCCHCAQCPALSRCHCQCSERLLADGPSLPAAVAAAAAAVAFVRSATQQTTRVSTHLGYTDVPCKLNTLTPTVAMGTAIKHPVPDRVKPSFVIFDIRTLWRSAMSVRVPGCQKLQMTA